MPINTDTAYGYGVQSTVNPERIGRPFSIPSCPFQVSAVPSTCPSRPDGTCKQPCVIPTECLQYPYGDSAAPVVAWRLGTFPSVVVLIRSTSHNTAYRLYTQYFVSTYTGSVSMILSSSIAPSSAFQGALIPVSPSYEHCATVMLGLYHTMEPGSASHCGRRRSRAKPLLTTWSVT